MTQGVLLLIAHLEHLTERGGRAAGGIDLVTMMHLDHFQIKIRPQYFRGFAGEPERVHAGRIITRPNDGNGGLVLEHPSFSSVWPVVP